jgi:hypothetical protein
VTQLTNFSNSAITFYWVSTASSSPVKYSYCLNNGQCNSGTVTFTVVAPSGYQNSSGVTTTTGNVNTAIVTPQGGSPGPQLILVGLNNPNGGSTGIQFLAAGSEPSSNPGVYSWIQLVNSDVLHLLDSNGRGQCTGGPPSGSPELDTSYPYGKAGITLYSTHVTNDTALDSPGWPVTQSEGEVERVFNATMYLMWTPNQDSECNSGTCTVPVPLGSLQNWNLNGDAINTLNPIYNQTTWGLNCEYPRTNGQEQVTFSPGTSYPTWTATYSGVQQCP